MILLLVLILAVLAWWAWSSLTMQAGQALMQAQQVLHQKADDGSLQAMIDTPEFEAHLRAKIRAKYRREITAEEMATVRQEMAGMSPIEIKDLMDRWLATKL